MKNKKEPQNFEDALKELEELSEMIQDDTTSLDQMLEIFERGSYLSKYWLFWEDLYAWIKYNSKYF